MENQRDETVQRFHAHCHLRSDRIEAQLVRRPPDSSYDGWVSLYGLGIRAANLRELCCVRKLNSASNILVAYIGLAIPLEVGWDMRVIVCVCVHGMRVIRKQKDSCQE